MTNFENLNCNDVNQSSDEKVHKFFKEKASIKELLTPKLLNDKSTLFFTSAGMIIGKPYVENIDFVGSYIVISDAIFIDSISPLKKMNFVGGVFQLAIDQIIGFVPIDEESFLHDLESQ